MADLNIKPGSIPPSAWTERASDVCCICGGSVDNDEHEDLLDMHDEFCIGCPLCEIPIRLFQFTEDERTVGVAMHLNCFRSILV